MINWLSSLPGVVLGYSKLEQLMIDFNGNVEPLLEYEEFLVQLKNNNPKVLDFVKKEAITLIQQENYYIDITHRKFLEILNQEYIEECDQQNYNRYIVYPENIIEIFELDVPAFIAPFFDPSTSEEFIKQALQLIFRNSVPEPQLSNINRLINLLISKNASQVSSIIFLSKAPHKNIQQPIVNFFLNHIQSQSVTNIIIQLFNPENQQQLHKEEIPLVKLEFLTLIIKGFDILEPLAVLNVTLLIHEILTHFNQSDGAQVLMKYLTSSEVLNKMFDIIEINQNNIVSKSAAHILSLISNYYSYSMQNITIFEPEEEPDLYNSQLTELFESTQFMDVFMKRLYIISDHIKTRKLSVLNLKLIEIIDNIIRISNLKLWKHLQELNVLEHLVFMFFNFPLSNILHSLIEKLILYVFNRTISDFHPFWGLLIVTNYKLCEMLNYKISNELFNKFFLLVKELRYGPFHHLANNLNWFQKELTEKMILSGDQIKYYVYVRKIVHHFENNIDWIDCQLALINLNKRNRIELGSGILKTHSTPPQNFQHKELDDQFKDRIFQQTKTNQANIQQLAVCGDDPVPFDDQTPQEEYIEEPVQHNSPSPTPKEAEPEVEKITEEVVPTPVLQELPKIPIVVEVSLIKDFKYESYSPYSPRKNFKDSDKIKHNSGTISSSSSDDEEEEDLEHLKQVRDKRNSEQLESSIKLKQIGEEQIPHEFQIVRRHSINFDQKLIIQPQNMKVLKVDEIDMNSSGKLNESFSSLSSRGSLRKIKVQIKDDCKVLKYEEDSCLVNSQISMNDSFTSRSMGDSQILNDEKKFRKIQEKDKKFLNFLNSIK